MSSDVSRRRETSPKRITPAAITANVWVSIFPRYPAHFSSFHSGAPAGLRRLLTQRGVPETWACRSSRSRSIANTVPSMSRSAKQRTLHSHCAGGQAWPPRAGLQRTFLSRSDLAEEMWLVDAVFV